MGKLREVKKAEDKLPGNVVGCRACYEYIEHEITYLTDTVEDSVEGLCLDCIQFPDEFDGDNCRVKH